MRRQQHVLVTECVRSVSVEPGDAHAIVGSLALCAACPVRISVHEENATTGLWAVGYVCATWVSLHQTAWRASKDFTGRTVPWCVLPRPSEDALEGGRVNGQVACAPSELQVRIAPCRVRVSQRRAAGEAIATPRRLNAIVT